MSHQAFAEVTPGETRVRTTLGQWLDIPRKVMNYLRERLIKKCIVKFVVAQRKSCLVATRVLHIISPVSTTSPRGYNEGGIVIVDIPNTGRFSRPVEALYGHTYASSDGVGSRVLIQGDAMTFVAEMTGFRSGSWVFNLYLRPRNRHSSEYVVTDPSQIRAFLGRPVLIAA